MGHHTYIGSLGAGRFAVDQGAATRFIKHAIKESQIAQQQDLRDVAQGTHTRFVDATVVGSSTSTAAMAKIQARTTQNTEEESSSEGSDLEVFSGEPTNVVANRLEGKEKQVMEMETTSKKRRRGMDPWAGDYSSDQFFSSETFMNFLAKVTMSQRQPHLPQRVKKNASKRRPKKTKHHLVYMMIRPWCRRISTCAIVLRLCKIRKGRKKSNRQRSLGQMRYQHPLASIVRRSLPSDSHHIICGCHGKSNREASFASHQC